MAIILFDGECNLCNSSVQFIINKDPDGYFQFASLQGKTGQKLLKKCTIYHEIDSIVLIENDRFYIKSSAALKICKKLKGIWKLCSIFEIIPPFIRDCFYDIVAKNRYKWFGRKESCMVPTLTVKKRFLD
ncbi:thiol-disulfide oxidoreductase DCC family protein [Bacillus sp. EB600]|uniref:thiol-disulfide oxidoreductase DCC family protein n=1 Tax=Bacillus sp. EB600 TaxID=2806345 RepID=UPI00210E25C6|nr:DCC1-like thiol-disulfide oxidoreductase family protein [Bacillus sp. EB600]MCQ6280391.1 DUF393 domain-containing protein [Bacillus sp. EB600]